MKCEDDELEKVEGEDEEGEALLPHPSGIALLDNQQAGHARKLELNHQRRKNERGMISSSQPKLKAKTSLTLIPANIKLSKEQSSTSSPFT